MELAVGQPAARARRLEVVTITDAECRARIHHAAHLAETATSPDDVAECVRVQLVSPLYLRGCHFRMATSYLVK
ncbi:hypothetical protein ACWEN3_28375 [Streptomyces sp. NPDC004561]